MSDNPEHFLDLIDEAAGHNDREYLAALYKAAMSAKDPDLVQLVRLADNVVVSRKTGDQALIEGLEAQIRELVKKVRFR